MSDTFTAGPWSRDQYGTLLDANGSTVLFRGVSVAASGSRVAEAEANTDLIAAVHDLLNALKDCVAVMERDLHGLSVIQPELCQARTAIAKATGAKP